MTLRQKSLSGVPTEEKNGVPYMDAIVSLVSLDVRTAARTLDERLCRRVLAKLRFRFGLSYQQSKSVVLECAGRDGIDADRYEEMCEAADRG